MANVSVDQILEQIANALMDDAGGQQTLGSANYSGGGNFLNQVVVVMIQNHMMIPVLKRKKILH